MKHEAQVEKLYQSLTDVDPAYLQEAGEPLQKKAAPRKQSWKTWGALAACLCLIAGGIFAGTRLGGSTRLPGGVPAAEPTQTAAQAEHTEQATPAAPAASPAEISTPAPAPTVQPAVSPAAIQYNQTSGSPAAECAMIALHLEDYRPMDTREILKYFGLTLQNDCTLAGLPLIEGDYGVYEAADRGVYYDWNTLFFSAGGKKIVLSLRTVFSHLLPTSAQVMAGPEEMALTDINGWQLVLFQYQYKAGKPLLYTEFVQDGTVYALSAAGLTDAELAAALGQILPEKEPSAENTMLTGTVVTRDDRIEDSSDGTGHQVSEIHDWIEVDCSGTRLTVWLPGAADAFQAGDQVAVSFRGEPATAYNIWPGQLDSVVKVG